MQLTHWLALEIPKVFLIPLTGNVASSLKKYKMFLIYHNSFHPIGNDYYWPENISSVDGREGKWGSGMDGNS